jgi:hypothetical protein
MPQEFSWQQAPGNYSLLSANGEQALLLVLTFLEMKSLRAAPGRFLFFIDERSCY